MSRLAAWTAAALFLALVSISTTGCLSTSPGPIDAARRFDEAVAAGDRSSAETVAGAEFNLNDPGFAVAASARRGFGETAAEYSANIAAPQASVEVFLPEENARFAVELVEEADGRWVVVSYMEAQEG